MSESGEVGESIGYQLRRLRRLRKLTQKELADRANVSRDLVAKLEQGRRQTARLSSLAKFARALDVELSELVGRSVSVLDAEASEAAGPVALRNAPMASGAIDGDVSELSFALAGVNRVMQCGWSSAWSVRTLLSRSRVSRSSCTSGSSSSRRSSRSRVPVDGS